MVGATIADNFGVKMTRGNYWKLSFKLIKVTFSDNNFTVQLNRNQLDLFTQWIYLTDNQKKLIYQLIKEKK